MIDFLSNSGAMIETWHILIALAVVAFIFEIFTAGFISGSVGIGFLVSGVFSFLGLNYEWQIFMFSVGLGLTFLLIRPLIMKYAYDDKNKITTNKDALIGKEAMVIETIDFYKNTGRVKIDGDDWKAKSKNKAVIPIGTLVKVITIESIVLIVN